MTVGISKNQLELYLSNEFFVFGFLLHKVVNNLLFVGFVAVYKTEVVSEEKGEEVVSIWWGHASLAEQILEIIRFASLFYDPLNYLFQFLYSFLMGFWNYQTS